MSDRQRVWAFIAYPESLPDDWIQRLSDRHIPVAISPLHDRDLLYDNDDIAFNGISKKDLKLLKYNDIKALLLKAHGTINYKKQHYHILLSYSGVKSYDQVAEFTLYVAGTNPIKVEEIGGYARYLIHEDDPDKFHYYKQDVISLCGMDYDGYFECPKSQAMIYLRQICNYIIDNDIREFADLEEYCLMRKPEWFYVLMSCYTQSIKEVIKSRRHKLAALEKLRREENYDPFYKDKSC